MGIKNLMKVIQENAPDAIKETTLKNLFGRKICIDASMVLYQFLIAVRPDETNSYTLMNEHGEATSHIGGIFYRTIKMIEFGIKPIFIFDGKPPSLKSGELAKRSKRRKEAEESASNAKEEGDMEALSKINKRIVKVTPQHNSDAKKLLNLMGVPIIDAPSEAEAQCAALVRHGICYGSGSDDMDSLTLGAPLLLRHMNQSESRGPILEIRLEKVLQGLDMTFDQFVDLSILLGCDYCDSIRGIGAKRAVQLIQKYKNIESVLKEVDQEKYKVPENFPYNEIRDLFKNPQVYDPSSLELKWNDPDFDGLIKFLVTEKGFSEERVKKGYEKIVKSRNITVQGRITSFFNSSNKVINNRKKSDLNTNETSGSKLITNSNEVSKSESAKKEDEIIINIQGSSSSEEQKISPQETDSNSSIIGSISAKNSNLKGKPFDFFAPRTKGIGSIRENNKINSDQNVKPDNDTYTNKRRKIEEYD